MTRARRRIGIVGALSLLVASACRSGATSCPREVLGICLDTSVQAELRGVERLYGTALHARLSRRLDVGGCDVTDEGVPTITLNPALLRRDRVRQETAILHELFHLELRAEGFGGVLYEFLDPAFRARAGGFLEEMVHLVHSPIEHTLFFRQMREMGYEPGVETGAYFARIHHGGQKPPANDDQRTVFYMRASLELDDPALTSMLAGWYTSRGWSESARKGERLARLVVAAEPRDPTGIAETFVQCMNVLLEGRVTLRFTGWRDEVRGRLHVRAARVEVVEVR